MPHTAKVPFPAITLRLPGKQRLTSTWRPRKQIPRLLTRLLMALFPLGIALPSHALDINALPTGGRVTAGNAAISQSANALTIQQASQRAALDWQSFNIGAQASVTFNQPNSSAVALNRIGGINGSSGGSEIYGKLNANGQVFLLNPNGVLFARGSEINVGGLLATTMNLGNSDFMAGNYHLTQGGNSAGSGSIRNEGLINALGSVALVGNSVQNAGQIIATTATLAAGNSVAVDLSGDGLIRARVDNPVLKASIANSGNISAATVTLTAGQSREMIDSLVNNSGVIRATGLTNVGGEILLEGGTVDNSGSIAASGTNGGGHISLMGNMAGGTVRVGGTLDASAPVAGDGGFIETSAAHVHVADAAHITTAAATGNSGTWLIDPNDYTIAASGGDISGAALGSNLNRGNVTVQSSSGAAAGSGDIVVNDPVAWSAGNTLTLSAFRDIDIKSTISATAASAGLNLNSNLGNVGGISNLTGTVTLNGGTLRFTGGVLNLFNAGMFVGGTLASTNGTQLVMGANQIWDWGRLDNVVLDVDVMISNNSLVYYNTLTIANGHKITLASTGENTTWLSGGSDGAQLLASGGIGEVVFAGTSSQNFAVESCQQARFALTIGPNVLIHGTQGGTVGNSNTAITNKGTIQTDNATVRLYFSSWANSAGGVINVNGGALNLGDNVWIKQGSNVTPPPGPFNASGLAGVSLNRTGGSVNLTGTMINTGNTFSLDGIGTLNLLDGGKIVGGTLTSSNGSQLVVGNGQAGQTGTLDSVVFNVDTTVTNNNTLLLSNIATNTRTIQTGAGSNVLTNNTSLTNAPTGIITGGGKFDLGTGTLTNNGTIAPGSASAPGILSIAGNLINNGTIQTRIGGTNAGNQYDQLAVSGTVKLGGTLTSTLSNGFTPSGQTFDVITANSISGAFSTLNMPSGSNTSVAITGNATKAVTIVSTGGTPQSLPTLEQCVANTATPGCSAVLPSIATCTTTPSTPGCSVVVPSVSTCTTNSTAEGCSTVQPTPTTCTGNPSAAGCSAVLPSISACTTNPTTAGCSTVQPTPATCTSNLGATGCPALPTDATATPQVAADAAAKAAADTITATTIAATVQSATTSVVQGTIPSLTSSMPQTVASTAPASTSSSGSGSSGTTTTSSSTTTTQASPSDSSSDSKSGDKQEPAATPVITTVVIANSTVQKPAEQVVQTDRPRGRNLACRIGG